MPDPFKYQVQEILNRVFDDTNNRLNVGLPSGSTITSPVLAGTPTYSGTGWMAALFRAPELTWAGYYHGVNGSLGRPTSVVTGSGAVTATATRQFTVDTGATAGSTAISKANTFSGLGWSKGQASAVVSYDKGAIVCERVSLQAATANGIIRSLFGVPQSQGATTLAAKGFGWSIKNRTLFGLGHDGSTATETTTGQVLALDTVYTITSFLDGAGNVLIYLDGALVLTMTAKGPTGVSVSGNCAPLIYALNGVDAAAQTVYVHEGCVGVGQ